MKPDRMQDTYDIPTVGKHTFRISECVFYYYADM